MATRTSIASRKISGRVHGAAGAGNSEQETAGTAEQ